MMKRLTDFNGVGEEDLAFFRSLCEQERFVQRRQVIRAQSEPAQQIFLLCSGWAASCVDLRNGERQIVKVHLPGDVLAAPSLSVETAAETLVAMTDVTVRSISLNAIGRIFKEAPALAASLFVSAQQERVFLMERLATIGRMQASDRLVALLLHVHDRLSHAGLQDGSVEWPLTQSDVADVLGLTTVHVNRVIKTLERQGLIQREGSTTRLIDVDALRRLSGLPKRRWVNRPEWLVSISG